LDGCNLELCCVLWLVILHIWNRLACSWWTIEIQAGDLAFLKIYKDQWSRTYLYYNTKAKSNKNDLVFYSHESRLHEAVHSWITFIQCCRRACLFKCKSFSVWNMCYQRRPLQSTIHLYKTQTNYGCHLNKSHHFLHTTKKLSLVTSMCFGLTVDGELQYSIFLGSC
jgi:hypothetical protein